MLSQLAIDAREICKKFQPPICSVFLPLNPVIQTAMKKIPHRGTFQEICRETGLDFARLVRLRELSGIQQPFEAIQVVFKLLKFSRAENGSGATSCVTRSSLRKRKFWRGGRTLWSSTYVQAYPLPLDVRNY
jgi:hypothetical protein